MAILGPLGLVVVICSAVLIALALPDRAAGQELKRTTLCVGIIGALAGFAIPLVPWLIGG